MLLAQAWPRDDGATLKIERLLVDARFMTDTVKNWARTTPHAGIVMPSQGFGYSAKSKPWEEYDRTRCERLGTHWLIPKLTGGKQSSRIVTIDTNHWKSFVAARLAQAVGDKGALLLFGTNARDHRMIADHICSEYWTETEGRGRRLQEWQFRPGQSENHWFDGLVGSAVAASMIGLALPEHEQPKPKKQRLSLQEMARRAAEKAHGPR